MSMYLSKDMLKVIKNQNFRNTLGSILLEVTGSNKASHIVLDMLETYYSTHEEPTDKVILLPYGYCLNIRKFGGFYLTHASVDCGKLNKKVRASTPNFYLFFNRRRRTHDI
tara:strand:+ start:537 stop:869 length:333 start_codon:yes stop_codon:yes gene_type:complete